MVIEVKDVDREFYAAHLADMLPPEIIDVHTHIWLKSFVREFVPDPRLAQWPERVAADQSIEDLCATYDLMFPGHQVTPVLFGWPERSVDLAQTNAYVARVCGERGLPGLLVSVPEWSGERLEAEVKQHGLLGLKPYLSFAPPEMKGAEVTVYDFLPRHQLEVADAHGWIVMLHIPRPGRLKDPVNLQHLLEIERRYPRRAADRGPRRPRLLRRRRGRRLCGAAPDRADVVRLQRQHQRRGHGATAANGRPPPRPVRQRPPYLAHAAAPHL